MQSSSVVDMLTDVLQRSRARGALFSHTTAHGAWGVRFPAAARLSVHAIVAGEAHLWAREPDQALRLIAGDVVLVRKDIEHQMAYEPGASAVPFGELPVRRDPPGTGRGRRRSSDGVLLRRLRLRRRSLAADARFAPGRRPDAPRAREHAARDDGPARARDHERRIGPASAARPAARRRADPDPAPALHRRRRGRTPVVPRLRRSPRRFGAARPARGSRSTVDGGGARRRGAPLAIGVRPALHRAPRRRSADVPHEWRMSLARERLRHGDERLAAIASAVGYASEFAFAAAFKRHHGVAPGRWRAAA